VPTCCRSTLPVVAERNINTVRVATSRGIVALPWSSREALLAEFSHLDSMRQVREKFDAVGRTQPVELTMQQQRAGASRTTPPCGSRD
jgi:hypothetical protein